MTEKEQERVHFLKKRFKWIMEQEFNTPKMRKSKPFIVVSKEDVEGEMERPGIDTKPFSYHIENGRAVRGR